MEIIVTSRLRLRPLEADDLRAFVAYRSHPDIARYPSWDPTYAMTDAEALLAAQADVVFGTPGAWVQVAALDRLSGELVGDCAVHVRSRSARCRSPSAAPSQCLSASR
jgi:RimJ/RimL family protein N-acetyltransferase